MNFTKLEEKYLKLETFPYSFFVKVVFEELRNVKNKMLVWENSYLNKYFIFEFHENDKEMIFEIRKISIFFFCKSFIWNTKEKR